MEGWRPAAVPIGAMLAYPPAMLLLQRCLRETAYDTDGKVLRLLVGLHNAALCIASAVLSLGAFLALWRYGPYATAEQFFCLPGGVPAMPVELRFWVQAFYLSKYWELLDTVLLVLRRKPLTFLHVYHHAVVIPEIWILGQSQLPWSLGCVIMNAGVHVVMYYYFAVASTGRKIWWRRYVTLIQIAQFCTAAPCALAYVWFHFASASGCWEVRTFLLIGAFDGSLLLLFLRFHLASQRLAEGKRAS
mmetsp:Transcript_89659/g.262125  ORF Transcript_89659/g.262125 Transcript_89659/m.262125 type:complete len:246 (+) Transcript_89659:55-792(+)